MFEICSGVENDGQGLKRKTKHVCAMEMISEIVAENRENLHLNPIRISRIR